MPAKGVSCSTGGGGETTSPTDCGTLNVLVADDPDPEDEPKDVGAPTDDLLEGPDAEPEPALAGVLVPVPPFGLTGLLAAQLGGHSTGSEAPPGRVGAEVEGAGALLLGTGTGRVGTGRLRLREPRPRPRFRLTPRPAAETGRAAEVTANAAASPARADAASSRRTEPVS